MFDQIIESFFSKFIEKIVDYGFDTFSNNLGSTLETLKNNLNSLSDKAFVVEEKIKKAELFGTKKRKREVEEWLKQVKLVENKVRTLESEVQTQGFVKKFIGGDKATQLSIEVEELVEQSKHFDDLLDDIYEKRGEKLLTANLSGKGFKENLKRIWNLLKYDKVSSIGIYGMGGVGKTALARHINNIILEKRKDTRVCWITVSQVFSIKKLQDQIARSLGLDILDEDDEDKRAARLHRAIRKNFILILDDVWENICLEKLGDLLHLEGCKLILTTRSFEVCCQMGCQEKFEVKKLHEDEAWNLFKQKLGQDFALCLEVKNIAEGMAKVCGGLPLGIIVLAGSMRGETSIHVWRNELEKLRDPNMVHDDDEDNVFKVLRYSFDRLDLNHQRCFLQCSLYPEDYSILKKELSKGFISEELVDIRKNRQSQLDQAHSILNKLVKVCLLENADEYCVKMHDLVRSMALKVTKGKNMVTSGFKSLKEIPNEAEWTKDLEKVSLMRNDIIEIPDGILPNCPSLTMLILSKNPLNLISDSFFSRLDNLCSLDLSDTLIEKLPDSLSNLENLKVLNLRFCTKLVDIPNLGKLKKLRELDLSFTAIRKLPQGMKELVSLTSLSLVHVKHLVTLPEGFFLNFPLLQCLHLPFHIKAPVEEISKLKHLELFWGRVKNVSDFNKCMRCRQSLLSMFKIMVNGEYYRPNFMYGDDRNEVILRECDLKNEKEEDLSMLYHDIQSLELNSCKGLSILLPDNFLRLKKPNSLKVLKIANCQEIECFLTNEQFLMANPEFKLHFRNLEEIKLTELQNFVGFIQNVGATIKPSLPHGTIFSPLRSLSIHWCNNMRKLGLPLLEFQNLEEVNIGRCDELEEIIEIPDGEGHVISLPKLKKLSLWDLPRLKSICNTTISCGSIRCIALMGCCKLKKLPLHLDPISHSPPQTLEAIWVRKGDKEWWESLEWEHPTHCHLLQPLVKFSCCLGSVLGKGDRFFLHDQFKKSRECSSSVCPFESCRRDIDTLLN